LPNYFGPGYCYCGCYDCTAESAVAEAEENVSVDHSVTSVTTAVPSSCPQSTVSTAAASDTVDSSVELSTVVPCSLPSSVTSSLSSVLDQDLHSNAGATVTEVVADGPSELLASPESSATDLSQFSEEISTNTEMLFNDQKLMDNLFLNSRNMSSSSLSEISDSRRSRTTNPNRKRGHEDEAPEFEGLTFDKLPNYYTALSIPARVMAGSAARSSSDLIADFLRNERDPSPERKSCSVYDKLPAYYSTFTNSTRYDDDGCAVEPLFETSFPQDETEDELRYGRSCDDSYELHDLKSASGELPPGLSSTDNDCVAEKDSNTKDVSHF